MKYENSVQPKLGEKIWIFRGVHNKHNDTLNVIVEPRVYLVKMNPGYHGKLLYHKIGIDNKPLKTGHLKSWSWGMHKFDNELECMIGFTEFLRVAKTSAEKKVKKYKEELFDGTPTTLKQTHYLEGLEKRVKSLTDYLDKRKRIYLKRLKKCDGVDSLNSEKINADN